MAEVTLQQIGNALLARDPRVVGLIQSLASAPLPHENEDGTPFREGAPTLNQFIRETRNRTFRKTPPQEQEVFRVQQLAALEAEDAEVPCPDRLKLYEVMEELWEGTDVFSRTTLLEVLRTIPFTYGPWRAVKRIFKEAEARNDTEVYGIIAARIDMEANNPYRPYDGPTRETLLYMRRRAWQYLRRIGKTLPAIYPDVASDFLSSYGGELGHWDLRNTWIAAHIFCHENGSYSRNRFKSVPNTVANRRGPRKRTPLLDGRAFSDLWRRSPRPLFSLLERAKSEVVLGFATDSLKADFRASLREVEPEWVNRLLASKSAAVDEFVVWILKNVPKFEQSAFRDLGLHNQVLGLLTSDSNPAVRYAVDYAKPMREISIWIL